MKKTRLASILWMKCPKCQEGDLYASQNPYNLGQLTEMHKACKVCGESFTREPGFYFGAAYVSYALTVAIWVAVLVALMTFDALGWINFSFFENPITFILSGIITLLLSLPYLYRVSRSIWIHMFVSFDRSRKK